MLRNIFETIKSKPKNKFSLEHLQFLYHQLVRNPIINDQNKEIIIESLRQIAELMIWGDQHNSELFDFFLEKNLLSFFLRILSQTRNRQVKIQLIQTLSILIENIRNQNSIYYILSNNHVNELITHKFDFSDDEVLAYYISLLKTLSLKLNLSTIQFFFNETENDFPLYTEAIKFFNHRDSMIRIAVRTLTLNVFKVEDETVRHFILDKTAAPYFSNIVWFIRDQCYTLDTLVINSSASNRGKLNDFISELLDFFYYLHDIFNLGITALNEVLSDHLLQYLLLPQFITSLIPDRVTPHVEDKLSPLVAVFLLTQVFYIFTYKPLINTLAAFLIHPAPTTYTRPFKVILPPTPPPHLIKARSTPNLQQLEKEAVQGQSTDDSGNKYYNALLSFVDGDDRVALPTMCLLYAMVKSSAVDQLLLEMGGLYPYRLSKAKRLLEALTATSPEKTFKPAHTRSLSDPNVSARKFSRANQLALKIEENSPLPIEEPEPKREVESPVSTPEKHVESSDKEPVADQSTLTRDRSSSSVAALASSKEHDNQEEPLTVVRDTAILQERGPQLIVKLLHVLLRSEACRLITLQLAVVVMKELVYSQDSSPNLNSTNREEAYRHSVNNLKDCLQGPMADIFLELFEQELKLYKQINFDALLNDFSSLLMPINSIPGIALAKRVPSGLAETTQRAIQAFLVMRELKYTMFKIKDEKFPLKEEPLPSVKVNQSVEFTESDNCMVCTMLTGTTKKRIKVLMMIDHSNLIITESDKSAPKSKGVVNFIVPVQSIEIQMDKLNPKEPSLSVTNHIVAWSGTFLFDAAEDTPLETVQHRLETAKLQVRSAKLDQISSMLTECK